MKPIIVPAGIPRLFVSVACGQGRFFLCCFSMRQRYNGKQPPRRPWRPRWRTESLVPIRLRRAAIWSLFLLALGAFIQCIYAMLGQVVFREFGLEAELRSGADFFSDGSEEL